MTANVVIERMKLEDLPAVCQLETDAGMSTLGEVAFAKRLADAANLLYVARAPQVVGMFSGWVVVDELEIDNIVVASAWQRQGIGAALMRQALRDALLIGGVSAVLEVRESNLGAQKLYEQLGFVTVGRRGNYYRDPKEDALIMKLSQIR